MIDLDEDALVASVDLIGRTGARDFTFGYLRDDVPIEQAEWWAAARYQGAEIREDGHAGPLSAVEALARRLLTGGMCIHCGGRISLSEQGPPEFVGTMLDGTRMDRKRARSMPECRWQRVGARWMRGCESREVGS